MASASASAGAGRGRAQPREQLDRRAAAVSVAAKKAVIRFSPRALPSGRGVAVQEGEGDGRVDVGEDGGGAGPEAVQQAAQLVGQREALGDQSSRPRTRRATPWFVRAGRERAEAVAVRAEEVVQDEGVAGVALAAGGGVTRPQALTTLGWMGTTVWPASTSVRRSGPTGARWPRARRRPVPDDRASCESLHAAASCVDVELDYHRSFFVDHADGVAEMLSESNPQKYGMGSSPLVALRYRVSGGPAGRSSTPAFLCRHDDNGLVLGLTSALSLFRAGT